MGGKSTVETGLADDSVEGGGRLSDLPVDTLLDTVDSFAPFARISVCFCFAVARCFLCVVVALKKQKTNSSSDGE